MAEEDSARPGFHTPRCLVWHQKSCSRVKRLCPVLNPQPWEAGLCSLFRPRPCLAAEWSQEQVRPLGRLLISRRIKQIRKCVKKIIIIKKAIPPLPSPIFLWGVKIYISFPLKYVIYVKCNGFVIVVILNLSNKCLKCPVLISSAENMDVYHPHKHKLSRFPHIFYFFPGMSRTLVT